MNPTHFKDTLTLIGGIAGLLAFLWKIYDTIWATVLSHVNLELDVQKQKSDSKQIIKICTWIENKSGIQKKIDFSFVLIYPDRYTLDEALQKISASNTPTFHLWLQELFRAPLPDRLSQRGNEILFYPIPYYFRQRTIGNEKMKFAFAYPPEELKENAVYQVAFVILTKPAWGLFVRSRLLIDTFLN